LVGTEAVCSLDTRPVEAANKEQGIERCQLFAGHQERGHIVFNNQ
jgi:hypothetical protein